MIRALLLLSMLLAGLTLTLPPGSGESRGHTRYRATLAGCAWVLASNQGKGTGWLVDGEKRLLVTCYHVVGESESIEVVFPWLQDRSVIGPRSSYLEHLPRLRELGLAVQGKVIRRIPEVDLALIELASLPPGTRALHLRDTCAHEQEQIHLVGNRGDSAVLWMSGHGIVRTRLTLRAGYFNAGKQLARGVQVLLTTLPINEGDSGAPVVDDQGAVVGVAAAVAWEVHGAGLCLSVEAVRQLLTGKASPAQSAISESASEGHSGVVLVEYPGGHARAGILLDRERRLVLTTARAVGRDERIEVVHPVGKRSEGAWYRLERAALRTRGFATWAIVLAKDEQRNLALLEVPTVPASARALDLARQQARPGEELRLISHPRGLEVRWALARGWVRQAARLQLDQDSPSQHYLLVQAPLGIEEEGGPALDTEGQVVGLATGKAAPEQQIVFVLDVREIRAFLLAQHAWIQPATPEQYLGRGQVRARNRNLASALEDFTAGLALSARHAGLLVARASVRNQLGLFDLALKDCHQAGDAPGSHRERALALLGKHQIAPALEEANLAVAARDSGANFVRARVHLARSDLAAALRDADEAIWMDGELASGYHLRGTLRARKNALDEAMSDLTRALALDPMSPECLADRAELLERKGDREAAHADFVELLRRWPDHPRGLAGRGHYRLARGDFETGLNDLDRAIEGDPRLARAHLTRGVELLRRGQRTRAARDLVRACKLDPTLLAETLGELERKLNDLARTDPEGVATLLASVLREIAPVCPPVVRVQLMTQLANPAKVRDALALLALVRSARQACLDR